MDSTTSSSSRTSSVFEEMSLLAPTLPLQPPPAALDISGMQVRGGWLIRGLLMPGPTVADQRLALRMGYQAARWTTAGLALTQEGPQQLLLTHWQPRLPSAEAMHKRMAEFARGLEIWREALARARQGAARAPTGEAARHEAGSAHEHRIRRQILDRAGRRP
jgi:hypothetical protein